jgi:uncharacterized damage-inducible protein DinB
MRTAEATLDTVIADILAAWRTNDRINQYLIDHLTDEAWAAKPPGGKGRTIAAIFAHIHNVRHMWMQTAAKDAKNFEKVKKEDLTRAQAKASLAESAKAIERLLEAKLRTGKISGFPPNAAAFLAYIISHDAHHRGQAAMLARQLGHAVPVQATFGMWEWHSRYKETLSPQ